MKTILYDNRYLLVLTIVILIVGGLSALLTLPRYEDPRILNRAAFILTRFPGASAERVESQVTDPIETHIREVGEVLELLSFSRNGFSLVSIELKGEVTDIDTVNSKLRAKLNDAVLEFPDGVLPPFFDDQRGVVAYTSIVGLLPADGMEFQPSILNRLAEELANRLRNTPGTELARVFGGMDEEITVTVDRDELAALGLSAGSLANIIHQSDAKISSGMQRNQQLKIPIEVEGELRSIQQIAAIPILQNPEQQTVRVGDITRLEKGYETPPRSIARMMGERGVMVGARMEAGKRVDQWAAQAKKVIDDFKQDFQDSVKIIEVFDQNKYTEARLNNLTGNLVAGAGVIFFVIFFLMGWRSAILVCSALPLCVSAVLFGFNVFGVSIHQMSIFGMILALGLLIDNAIVMVDEMRKRILNGATPVEAMTSAINHLFIPLLCSTLTTVLAFMPILLLNGNIGEFIGTISAGVILALLSSYAISMTIIPALTAIFNQSTSIKSTHWWKDGFYSPYLLQCYRTLICKSLQYPRLSIFMALLIPLAGFMRLSELGDQFFPPADRDHFHLQLWMPNGTSIEETLETVRSIEQEILSFEDISNVNWMIGASFPTVYYNVMMLADDADDYAHAIIQTTDALHVKQVIPQLQARLEKTFPKARLVIQQFGQGPPVTSPIEIRVLGPNIRELRRLGEEIRLVLQSMPEVTQSFAFLEGGEPKYWFVNDTDEVQSLHLSHIDIAKQMQANLEGFTGGSVIEGYDELPVRIRYKEEDRMDSSTIHTMPIQTGTGKSWTPLSALGKLELRPEVDSIHRKDGVRDNTIRAYLTVDSLPPSVTTAFKENLADSDFVLPPSYHLEIGGESEEQSEAISNLMKYVPVLTILMIATLVLAFRSIMYAVMLVIVAVASVGISAFVVWLSGYPFGFNPIIGTAGLIGVAINDSIVVLAALHAKRSEIMEDINVIVTEVINITRHVMATTLTTIGGFLPLLLFSTGDFWPPLAVVIAGGVTGATILALFFIPQVFVLFHCKSIR